MARFDNIVEKVNAAIKDAVEYWQRHRDEIRNEGCRSYVVTVCLFPHSCKWCKEKNDE